MKLRVSSVIPQNPVFLWLWITLLVWWSGLAGRDIFLVPALIFFCIYIYQTLNKQTSIITTKWTNSNYTKCVLIPLFLVHVVLILVITILKYYSFRWNVWDVGSYSNMLYNISQGQFYSSYLGTHNWGDHFSPSMSPQL